MRRQTEETEEEEEETRVRLAGVVWREVVCRGEAGRPNSGQFTEGINLYVSMSDEQVEQVGQEED